MYIVKKILNKLETLLLKKYQIDNCLYLKNKNNKKIISILLYFDDYEFMHFGDHLFYEPLARELNNHNFYFEVAPIKAMQHYFKQNDIKFFDGDFNKFDLIITKVEFLSFFRESRQQVLFTDTACNNITKPLCYSLITQVFNFLEVKLNEIDDKPSNFINHSNKIDNVLDGGKKYILFNNYIDSGKIRSGEKHQEKIIQFAKNLKKNTNCLVIHTGSKKDKENDKNIYDFIDLDLRGKTTIEDLFYLSSCDNVIYNVAFDALQMHIFFLNNKKSYILFRGRFMQKNTDFIKNYVNPPFMIKNKIDLIEYI
jgi:hypothetical protein